MNYKERFDQIVELLQAHKNIWFNEVIQNYPAVLDDYPKQWLKELRGLNQQQLWRLDCLSDYSALETGDLKELFSTLKSLCQIEFKEVGDLGNLPDWAFNKVKSKKRHEILTLAKVFEEIQNNKPFSHLVDIGGGVGHMARIMAHYKGIECISLDINEEFQKFGQQRLNKYPRPDNAKDVSFITHDFSTSLTGKRTKEIFTKDSFSLGLHTCGPLANAHMDVALENETRGFINFGCCYNRLDPVLDTNRSNHARERNLKMSGYSLTLACRGHDGMDLAGFKHKRLVKKYRYALQLLFVEKFNVTDLVAVGDAHQRLYNLDFVSYAKNRISLLEGLYQIDEREIDEFYKREETQKLLDDLFLINIIRWQFGRALELYILLDRVLFLEEAGKKPKLFELFKTTLSPRNIAILCQSP